MHGALSAPNSGWPDASALPAHLHMGDAVVQLSLVMPHVRTVSVYVLMPWNRVDNKNDIVLHRFAQAGATSRPCDILR